MEICDRLHCTACGACMCVCPMDAISFEKNEKGFSYPRINKNCIECGACQTICPRNTSISFNYCEPKVYAAFTRDKYTRENSSAGGIFTELSKCIFDANGVVFASRFKERCNGVLFDSCNTIDELGKFRGSKYVQSSTGYIYRQVKKELVSGKEVLFIGVPCQVDGLKKFLGKDYDNLLTIDIICHGVPSPKLWEEYCSFLEKKNDAHITNVSFRYKKPNWTRFSLKIDFDNKKSIVNSKFDDPYIISFLNEISLRENCHFCEYTSINRVGDITLADFWGFHSFDYKMRNTEKGISLVLLNNRKGIEYFERIKSNIMYQERSIQEAINGNRSLKKPWTKNPVSDAFWDEYLHGDGMISAMEKYCLPYRFPLKTYFLWFVANHFYLIPKFILKKRKSYWFNQNIRK